MITNQILHPWVFYFLCKLGKDAIFPYYLNVPYFEKCDMEEKTTRISTMHDVQLLNVFLY